MTSNHRRASAPPLGLLMVGGAILAVQLGAAIAALFFDRVGAAGMVLLRQGLGAIVLLAVARPRLRGRTPADWAVTFGFAAVLAAMNLSFYQAVDRLPLGMAVTIELLGPLALAVALSRRMRDVAWTGLAIGGVVLLGEMGGGVDPVGVVFALAAAVGWAVYILFSRAVGQRFDGVDGLALAMAAAACMAAPFGIASGGAELLRPSTLLVGLGVALLSGVVNFSLELTALRTVATRTFGVLMSLSPAVAALAGLVLLGQALRIWQLLGVACVVVASAGTVVGGRQRSLTTGREIGTPAPRLRRARRT